MPPIEHPNINTQWISNFSFDTPINLLLCPSQIKKITVADLVFLSGEFIFYGDEIRRLASKSAKILVIPIGFDMELLTIDYGMSENPIKRAISAKMFAGLQSSDYVMCHQNTTAPIIDLINRAGLRGKTPTVWKHLHVIRLDLISKFFSENTARVDLESVLNFSKHSIFIASRLCPEQPESVANKGGNELFLWVRKNYRELQKRKIGVLFIDRDNYSKLFVNELRRACNDSQLIRTVNELSYVQFIVLLRNSLLAIDSFSLSDTLLPHMTTSDAISVGTPLVTSFGRTKISSKLRESQVIRTFSDPADYLFKADEITRHDEYDKKFLPSYHVDVYRSLYSLTDRAEADFLLDLVHRNDVSRHFDDF